MEKDKAVESLGQWSLLMPTWVKAALGANDRLKLYLSMLQSAAQHADAPEAPLADWARELGQLGLRDSKWLQDMVKGAYLDGRTLVLPQFRQFTEALAADLFVMARPICDSGREAAPGLVERRNQWLQTLRALGEEGELEADALAGLTRGNRDGGDSFHLLVMDLHKALNGLSVTIATETLDGAHVWQVAETDRPLIQAFMRGLNRTAPLKFSHPGLDTAVTRDGARLLIQNDIGTNDVHVLVIEVENQLIKLTYSDLHAGRFDFFRELLEEVGFSWTVFDPTTSRDLNTGKPYQVGAAAFRAADPEALLRALEAVAARIVFVIDWNRARKRLQQFVKKPQAYALLKRAAQQEWGHIAWLLCGAERLVFDAMQAVDSEAFRVGDRLDETLGDEPAYEFLSQLMRICSITLRQQQPVSLVEDEARMLLARSLRQRTFEFDLLAEHAAFCHALALALGEALEQDAASAAANDDDMVLRAKNRERRADHLLMEARQRAERQSRWIPVVELLSESDDVADALEEAIFILSLTRNAPLNDLPPPVTAILVRLTDTTLAAIQDLVKAVEIARHISDTGDPADTESFLQTLWSMLRAERLCDDLSRQSRRVILQSLHAAPVAFSLASDLATSIESASDGLLALGYSLRRMVFANAGMSR